MTKPAFAALKPGQSIGIVAPAGPASAEAVAAAPAALQALGYEVRLFPACHARDGFLAGDDAVRLADLHAAFSDPEIAAIVCLRGGYGSGRLLDRIDWDLLARHAKPFVGYSDITALHAQFSNRGIPSFHGPMLTSDLAKPECDALTTASLAALRDGWRAGDLLAPALGPAALRIGGRVDGRLVGGNLSLIAALMGTPWALNVRDAILFIEDVSEEPYRVDRLLLQLRLGGLLDQARGFVLGGFTGCEQAPDAVLRDYLLPLGKPVLGGWPAGHCQPNTLLPLGTHVTLDADSGHIELGEDLIV
jgi:muramoyltetrapeptide carboxypeptidase